MLQETGDAGSAAMGSPVSPEQVLKTLMNDGHFDSLRIKILNQLKQSEEIKNYTSTLVARSKVLNTPGAENKSRKELFEALRKELEEPVLEKASVAAWGIILDKEGVGKEIVEKVDAVYARLSGHDSSDSSPQVATQGRERPLVDTRPLPDLSIPSTSANGGLNRMHPNQVYLHQAYPPQRTPTDRGHTPWNDVSVTPGRRLGTDRGSTPRTDISGPPLSGRRVPQPEYYHAPDPETDEPMAQEVKPEECTKKWDVIHIPEELQNASGTVHILAASINPKLASVLIRDLGTKAPLTSLAHVKRIRRTVAEDQVQLSIILCPADGDASSDTFSIPTDVADIVDKHSLVPFLSEVSAHPASSREEWEAQCRFWPTSFHPNACIRGSKIELEEVEAESARKFMKAAIYQARLGHSSGQIANGAVVVDPILGSVISWGHDQSTVTANSPVYTCEAKENCIRHPLRHAVMEVISMAADRDRLLFPSNGTASCAEERSESDSITEFGSATKKARMDMVDVNGFGSGGISQEGSAVMNAPNIPRPYLCTGFDAYVTREPCAMCAMALVHQRVRRVFFGIPNTSHGALWSKYRLQGVRSLNHHYTVFQVAISECDLVQPP